MYLISGRHLTWGFLAAIVCFLFIITAQAQECENYEEHLRLVTQVSTSGSNNDLALSGNYLYVADAGGWKQQTVHLLRLHLEDLEIIVHWGDGSWKAHEIG